MWQNYFRPLKFRGSSRQTALLFFQSRSTPSKDSFWMPCFCWHLSLHVCHTPWLPMELAHSAEQLFINACWKDPARFDQASSPWCTPNAGKIWPQSVCHVSSQNPVGMQLRMGMKECHAPYPQISSICILSEFSYVPFLYCLKNSTS